MKDTAEVVRDVIEELKDGLKGADEYANNQMYAGALGYLEGSVKIALRRLVAVAENEP